MIQIEPAAERDIPVILRFIRELAEYEKLSHIVKADEDALRRTLFGERPAAEVILARDGEEFAGFALFFPNYSTFLAKQGLYLEDLYVQPASRGKGIGKALLVELGRIAHRRGYGRIEWSVLDWNQPAIGFYQRMGASMLDDWRICRVTGDAIAKLAGYNSP